MTQPKGFEHAKYTNKGCKPEMSIYGLKQMSWWENLFFHEKVKAYIFTIRASGSDVVFLVLYVDYYSLNDWTP